MTWTIQNPIPTLGVPDLAAGLAFYERLGFQVEWFWPEDGPDTAGLVRGACTGMLAECDPAERASVYFVVDDVDVCHAALLAARPWDLAEAAGTMAKRPDCPPARALRAPEAPVDEAYGMCEFAVVDPWGNQLSFGQTLHRESGP